MWWYWWMRNKGQECIRWLNYFLEHTMINLPIPEDPVRFSPQSVIDREQRGRASGRLGFYLMMHPKHLARAEELILESLATSRELGDQSGEAFALFLLGYTHYYGKLDFAAARSFFLQSLALYQSLEDDWGLGRNFYNLGNMEGHMGNSLSQCDYLESSLAVCRQSGDLRGAAIALDNLAAVRAEVDCDLQAGRKLVEEAMDIYRHLKASGAISNALFVYGQILAWQGDYPRARAIFQELEDVLRQRGGTIWTVEARSKFGFMDRLEGNDEQTAATFQDCLAYLNAIDPEHKQYQNDVIEIMIELGLVLTRSGDILRASSLFEEALSLAGTPLIRAKTLHGLGMAALAQVDGKAAAEYFLQSLQILQESSYRFHAITTLEDYAGALHLLEQDTKAARILGTMDGVRHQIGAPLPPGDRPRYERLLIDLKAILGETGFNQAWAEGQAMTLDEALAFALEL
jgi:tetratricopeptide (TPR) repeat protein